MVEIDGKEVEETYRKWVEIYEENGRDVYSTLRLLAWRFERMREQRDLWWRIAASMDEERARLEMGRGG